MTEPILVNEVANQNLADESWKFAGFDRYSLELGQVAQSLDDLHSLAAAAFCGQSEPSPALIHAKVTAVKAMLPVLKDTLTELSNWPNGPKERKSRVKKIKKEGK